MRVRYKYGIKTMSGKLDDLVHVAMNKKRVGFGRIFVMPRITEHNMLFAATGTNLADIWATCSEQFKEDLKGYTVQRIPHYTAEQVPAYANYANFVKFLYNYAKSDGAVDLSEITKGQLETAGCPMTVSEIIAAGLLPKVANGDDYTNEW
ncbi:MAG: hypothetical protein WCX83_03670 [Candidatus Cloacimonas sp.]